MAHDVHTSDNWEIMREIVEGELVVNDAGKAHIRKSKTKDKELGVQPGRSPALRIPLDKFIIDLLHMILRITERFLLVFVQKLISAQRLPKQKVSLNLNPKLLTNADSLFVCRKAKFEHVMGILADYGIGILEYDDAKNKVEIKGMIKGDLAKRIQKSMRDIMVRLQCDDQDVSCWIYFQACIDNLEEWEKGDATSEASDIESDNEELQIIFLENCVGCNISSHSHEAERQHPLQRTQEEQELPLANHPLPAPPHDSRQGPVCQIQEHAKVLPTRSGKLDGCSPEALPQ